MKKVSDKETNILMEIDVSTWKELDKIENKLVLAKILNQLQVRIKKSKRNDLGKCFNLLKKEFLIDCVDSPLNNEEIKDQRDIKHIKRDIRSILGQDGLKSSSELLPNAFVFGAGISSAKPFCIPNWTNLLVNAHTNFFMERYGREIEDDIVARTLGSADLYELAQYLESILSEDIIREYGEEFRFGTYNRLYSLVNEALYKNTQNKITPKNVQDSYIGYLAKLAKNHISRIITYNYDDCFEMTYRMLCPNDRIMPIFIDEQLPFTDEAKNKCIYHVHGFIPKESANYNGIDIKKYFSYPEARHIVLTEDSYDEIAHSNYKWRNTIQADTFVRYNCFIFGFSASDKNFKRLTKLMDWHQSETTGGLITQPVQHYIFLTIDEYLQNIFEFDKNECEKSFLNRLCELKKADGEKYDDEILIRKFLFLYYSLRSKRKYLRRFHIYPIWTTKSDVVTRVTSILGKYKN